MALSSPLFVSFCLINILTIYGATAASSRPAGAQYFAWSYDNEADDGPEHWHETYPACGGRSQSPVKLINAERKAYDELVFSNYDLTSSVPFSSTFTLTNTGHSAQVDVGDTVISVEGGGLRGTYRLAQFHFHWGENSSVGSEHLVADKAYPLEMHLVHYDNSRYESLAMAVESGDSEAVAVFAFFGEDEGSWSVEISELSRIVSMLSHIPYKGS